MDVEHAAKSSYDRYAARRRARFVPHNPPARCVLVPIPEWDALKEAERENWRNEVTAILSDAGHENLTAELDAANRELGQAPVITRKALQQIRTALFGADARPGHPSWSAVVAEVKHLAGPTDGLGDRGA